MPRRADNYGDVENKGGDPQQYEDQLGEWLLRMAERKKQRSLKAWMAEMQAKDNNAQR